MTEKFSITATDTADGVDVRFSSSLQTITFALDRVQARHLATSVADALAQSVIENLANKT